MSIHKRSSENPLSPALEACKQDCVNMANTHTISEARREVNPIKDVIIYNKNEIYMIRTGGRRVRYDR